MEDMNNTVIPENSTCEEKGNVKISVDVVATIAGIAANEIEGVAGMCGSLAGGIAEFLGSKKSATKGVKVEIQEEVAVIDLYVIVDYGIRIPELAWEIQENVKQNKTKKNSHQPSDGSHYFTDYFLNFLKNPFFFCGGVSR